MGKSRAESSERKPRATENHFQGAELSTNQATDNMFPEISELP